MLNNNVSATKFKLIQNHVHSWKGLTLEDVICEDLGGLSNINSKISTTCKTAHPTVVFFRSFGSDGVDRTKDNYIFHELCKAGLGPQCYGATNDYRVEEFVDATLYTYKDMMNKTLTRALARLAASIHKISMEKLDKTPLMLKLLHHNQSPLKDFREMLQTHEFSPEDKQKIDQIKQIASEDEIKFLISILPKDPDTIVFSHNDFHYRNFIIEKKNKTLIAIDFEYSDYNYKAYDIANLFNEMMIDYDKEGFPLYGIEEGNYPSAVDIIDFLNYYVFFDHFGSLNVDENKFFHDISILKTITSKYWSVKELNKKVLKLYKEMLSCRLLSHFYWIIWGVVQSRNMAKDFDYLGYALERYKIYQKFKEENRQIQLTDIESLLLKI